MRNITAYVNVLRMSRASNGSGLTEVQREKGQGGRVLLELLGDCFYVHENYNVSSRKYLDCVGLS
jgi:hypothetical protein